MLLAMFGEEAETLLQTIRQRHSREASLLVGDVDAQRGGADPGARQNRPGVGRRRDRDRGRRACASPFGVRTSPGSRAPTGVAVAEQDAADEITVTSGIVRIESPMVGIFYRAPQPGAPPFVEVGDVVSTGQTLCLLEAMKLFNELKADAEGRVRSIHADNGQAVEFGTLLFELEPVGGPPVV